MGRNHEIGSTILMELIRLKRLKRSDFIRNHHCRAASVLEAVNELKHAGLLIEPDRNSIKTGRRSPELCINPELGYFVGIELQPNRLLACVIDGAGSILHRKTLSHSSGVTAANACGLLREIYQVLQALMLASSLPAKGCGFADPGLVDVENQRSLQAVNIPGWKNIDIRKWLREITSMDNIRVLPETMARTYAEYYSRLPNAPESLFQISLNAGIGGGFIKKDTLFTGDTGRAMEIGHMVIQPDGPQCQCGNRGCLEAVAGQHGIRAKVMEMLANGVITELSPESFSLSAFSTAVKNRDRAAMLLAMDICECIASSLASVVTLLNPSAIILSGDLTSMGEMLLDTVKRTLALRCFPGATDILTVEYSRLDEYAAAYAAAMTARNHHLTQWQ